MVGLAICAQTSVADLFEVDGWPSWDGSGRMGTHSGKISVLWMRSLYSYGKFQMIGILSRILFAAPRQYEITFQLNLHFFALQKYDFFLNFELTPAHPAINA